MVNLDIENPTVMKDIQLYNKRPLMIPIILIKFDRPLLQRVLVR